MRIEALMKSIAENKRQIASLEHFHDFIIYNPVKTTIRLSAKTIYNMCEDLPDYCEENASCMIEDANITGAIEPILCQALQEEREKGKELAQAMLEELKKDAYFDEEGTGDPD